MSFSLTPATVWLVLIALQPGWPTQIAHNIELQTTGYVAYIHWPAVVGAAIGTVTWVLLVRWRLHTKPLALWRGTVLRSEEHTSELQSLMRISYAVFCLKKKKKQTKQQ